MAAGTVQSVLVCQDVASAPSVAFQNLCPAYIKNGAVQYREPVPVSSYLIDSNQASYFDAVFEPFDYTYAAGLWGLAFTSVLSLYLVAHSAGVILNLIRR